LKKQKKAQYFSNEHKSSNINLKRNAEGEHSQSPKAKKARIAHTPQPVASAKKLTTSTKLSSPKKDPASSRDKKCVSVPDARSKLEEEEDSYIAYLESKLGLRKSINTKNKSSDHDGLDGIPFFWITSIKMSESFQIC
jgi:nucleolar MIF4G domain-containing protein 1